MSVRLPLLLRWVLLVLPLVQAVAADITVGSPSTRAVTIYRSPYRRSGALRLDALSGFALVTETRTLSLPSGESRLRFPGVAERMEPASALLSGVPGLVLEKNHDAQTLSPSALVAATGGQPVTLVRTNRRTGRVTQIRGTLRAVNEGVVFESREGMEALRCSGLAESFRFEDAAGLTPTPVLSVTIASPQALETQATLSYVAGGFDWAAT